MKVIIAGSRGIPAEQCRELIEEAVIAARQDGIEITEIVCGESRGGMDKYVREWAKENGLPLKTFGTDYETNRAFAGYIRNSEMTDYGEALIAFSMGTTGIEYLIHSASAKRLPSVIIDVGPGF